MNANEKFLESIIQNQDKRTPGVHVTDITFPCLRTAWFKRQLGEFGTALDAFTLWHGRMMHLTPMLPQNELELQWEGITGRLDEYDPELGILIDKKRIKKIYKSYLPKQPHIYQLEAYNVLLVKNGRPPIKEAHILYLSKEDNERLDCEVTKKLRPVEQVAPQMLQARDIIQRSEPPPRNCSGENSWVCDYCSFVPKCYSRFKTISDLLPILARPLEAA